MRNTTPTAQHRSSEGNGVSGNSNKPRLAAVGHSAGSREMSDMVTVRDIEQLPMIGVKTIYAYVQNGLIPHVRIQANIRFIRDEILDWINQQSFHPGGPKESERKERG